MKKSINQNALFGAAKSALTYLFVIIFYKVAQDELLHQYIRYEIGLALSILFTAGLQSRSYKLLEHKGLRLLALLALGAGLLAQAGQLLEPWRIWSQLCALVALDRFADIMQQDIRQRGQFVRFNLWDMWNQSLTKGSYLLLAFDFAVMPILLALKSIIALGWLLVQFRQVDSHSFLPGIRELRADWNEWKHYVSFDALNYLSSHLDLLLLNSLAPAPFLLVYFYLRKFLRIPLILLNYVLDPAYVALRELDSASGQRLRVRRLWRPAAWVMAGYCLLLCIVLPRINPDPLLPELALLLFVSSVCYINLRMIDFSALLFWTQRRRSLARLVAAMSNALLILAAVWSGTWALALALAPFLGVLANQWIVGISWPTGRNLLWPPVLLLALLAVWGRPLIESLSPGLLGLGLLLALLAVPLSWVSVADSMEEGRA